MIGGIRATSRRSVQLYSIRCSSKGSTALQDRTANEQTRAARISELRKKSKEKMIAYEDLYRDKRNAVGLPDPPPDAAHVYLHHLDSPVPKKMEKLADTISDYIINTWLVFYPQGARLRKLQRDIAFRMDKPERPGKLPYEDILPIVGQLERDGKLRIRVGKQGRIVLFKPTKEQLEAEKLKAKIDNAVQKLKQVMPVTTPNEDESADLDFSGSKEKKSKAYKPKGKKRCQVDDDSDQNFFDMFGERDRGH